MQVYLFFLHVTDFSFSHILLCVCIFHYQSPLSLSTCLSVSVIISHSSFSSFNLSMFIDFTFSFISLFQSVCFPLLFPCFSNFSLFFLSAMFVYFFAAIFLWESNFVLKLTAKFAWLEVLGILLHYCFFVFFF